MMGDAARALAAKAATTNEATTKPPGPRAWLSRYLQAREGSAPAALGFDDANARHGMPPPRWDTGHTWERYPNELNPEFGSIGVQQRAHGVSAHAGIGQGGNGDRPAQVASIHMGGQLRLLANFRQITRSGSCTAPGLVVPAAMLPSGTPILEPPSGYPWVKGFFH